MAHSHGNRTGTPPERFTSSDPDAFEVPTGREEEWRFTPLRRLRELFTPFEPTTRITGEVSAPEGVSWAIEPLSPAGVLAPADRVSALALQRAPQSFVLRVAAGARLDDPVLVTGVASPGIGYEHMVIEVGERAQATVVVDYRGSATIAENVEILVGDGGSLELVSVQGWDADAVHLSAHAARIGRDAHLRHMAVNLGGAVVRLSPTVHFGGPGGRADLIGVAFAGPGQHLETRLYIDHDQPDCSSDVLYKNALQGDDARTVWIGDVRIRPVATGTNTFELNRNLVLTDGARADSVPNLEIETGEIVGAGHASATGRFDDEQLFYLMARGIPEAEARKLVVRGFFAELLDKVPVPELHDRLVATIEKRLAEVAGGPA
ncbi:MAG: Fe-S cluster assembly protein SufD [Micromonosporaceae bacterium]|nr:Fe-S cluster assembly protein SufD [Micromonosporaceae bacterium]